MVKEPLMCPSGELSYRLEPHDQFTCSLAPVPTADSGYGVGGVYPGWGGGWVPREGAIPGTQPWPDLRLIYGILTLDRFIRPFD